MSESLNQQAAPSLPDGVMDAVIQANVLFPQMLAGHAILGGSRSAQLVLEGQASWDDCLAAPSDEQADRLGITSNLVHPPAGIEYFYCRDVEGRTILKEDGLFGLFGLDRMRALVNDGTKRVMFTASRHATDALWNADDISTPGSSVADKKLERLKILFGETSYRPQAAALTGMWSAAANALLSPQGRQFSRQYRAHIPPPEKGLDIYRLAARSKVCALISGRLRDWLASQQPNVREHLPDAAVGQFVLDAVYNGHTGTMTQSVNAAAHLANNATPAIQEVFR